MLNWFSIAMVLNMLRFERGEEGCGFWGRGGWLVF